MSRSQARAATLAGVVVLLDLVGPASAQCLEWSGGFHVSSIVGDVEVVAVLDDGSGPALYVGGEITEAGGVVVDDVARFDGTNYEPMGSGFSRVTDLIVFDDGSGPAIYAGATYGNGSVARWDGSTWTPVGGGMDDDVLTLLVFDDGTGPALYAGGGFTLAGGVPARGVAKWDGAQWSALGGGLATVYDLAVYDDGGGPALFAGGAFLQQNGWPGNRVAKWNGSAWVDVGGGTDNRVYALEVFDDGSGPALYAGGLFISAGNGASQSPHVSRWDGSVWSSVGTGIGSASHSDPDRVYELLAFDDGSGPVLYAGGTIGGRVRGWDGTAWSVTTTGVGFSRCLTDCFLTPAVYALAAYDDGLGARLVAGGLFELVDDVACAGAVAYDGTSWSGVARTGGGLDPEGSYLNDLLVYDDGSGSALWATGSFLGINQGEAAESIARWDGSAWTAVPGISPSSAFLPEGNVLASYDAGSGPELYLGGLLTIGTSGPSARNIGRWDGSEWRVVGQLTGQQVGAEAPVHALQVFDEGAGPRLFVGGEFESVNGFGPMSSLPASRVARWDGVQWSEVGGGVDGPVRAMAVFDDGQGPALFVAGDFAQAGGAPTGNVARWDGTAWNDLDGGLVGTVRVLRVFDDGRGPALYAGGNFGMSAAGASMPAVAKWDGTAWTALGAGLPGYVYDLAAHHDASGGFPALYAGGGFGLPSGPITPGVARWDGSSWTTLDVGLNAGAEVRALAVFDDGAGGVPALYVGGQFSAAGGIPAEGFARWVDPCATCTASVEPYCIGKANSLGCVPFLTVAGEPSATSTDAFRITANDMVPNEVGNMFYGFKKAGLGFHGGVLCVKAPTQRLPVNAPKQAGPPPCSATLTRDFNSRIQGGADPLLTSGQVVFAQWRGRDPSDPLGFGDALTNGVRFTICP